MGDPTVGVIVEGAHKINEYGEMDFYGDQIIH